MHRSLRPIALVFSGLLFAAQALATNAGWRQTTVPGLTPQAPPIPVILYYPTQAPARTMAMGPFTAQVAIQAPPDAAFKGLIVLSHGIGGTELGHGSLAEGLAQQGYLVAALRHPGDNWQDRTLLQTSAVRYFTERPQHISRVIDALLRDPAWGPRIASDAQGPRIGALGHSAGGYTVLALAGGLPELARFPAHCNAHRADDPIFCSMDPSGQPTRLPTRHPDTKPETPASPGPTIPSLIDTRVRAVAALAPMAAVLTEPSLAAVRIPVTVYEAEQDRFLVPRFHAQWVARHVPGVELHRVPNAWHFAFMDTPSTPLPTEDGDIGANPPGFDRPAFLRQLARELPAFFDKSWAAQ